MKRRSFIQKTALTTGAISIGNTLSYANTLNSKLKAHTYNLKYAPHLGMFKHLAGEDPIDQLNFMADQGYTAFEDNEMRKRPVEQQEKMAKTMKERGLEMGVFVAHEIHWKTPNLASGDQVKREEFFSEGEVAEGNNNLRPVYVSIPVSTFIKDLSTIAQSLKFSSPRLLL